VVRNTNLPQVWAFDLDGTIAESKSSIDDDMADTLGQLLDSGVLVVIISGAGHSQFEKQVTGRLESLWQGTYYRRCRNLILLPLNGSETYLLEGLSQRAWKRVDSSDLDDDEKKQIFSAFERALEKAGWTPQNPTYGEIIEDRGGQITFSALGQKAPLELKSKYDPDQTIRLRIKKYLDPLLPEFNVRIGGTTSIDVNRKGFDKAYAVKRVMDVMKDLPLESYLFIGDALYEGGNDEPVKRLGVRCMQVSGPAETRQVILRMLNDAS
jgi:phosphomannomutase